eukprot:scaffold539548_cov19-Prasinocladus_malaysianus.AAC.1
MELKTTQSWQKIAERGSFLTTVTSGIALHFEGRVVSSNVGDYSLFCAVMHNAALIHVKSHPSLGGRLVRMKDGYT